MAGSAKARVHSLEAAFEEQQAMLLSEGFKTFEEYELMVRLLPQDVWMKPKPKATAVDTKRAKKAAGGSSSRGVH